MKRSIHLSQLIAVAALASGLARAQTTECVSLGQNGLPGTGQNGHISADGRFVAFVGIFPLLPGVTTEADVYLYDRMSGTTEREDLAPGGAEPDAYCQWPAISADGRFVAFASNADNLVAGDTAYMGDVFLRDRQNGTLECVSRTITGTEANGWSGEASSTTGGVLNTTGIAISADGRFVMFGSAASDLVPGDTNQRLDVFVRDRVNGTTERVSVSTSGAEADGSSAAGSMTPDGRFVLFDSLATNLVPGDTNGKRDTFVHDRQTGITECVSVSTAGVLGNYDSGLGSMSADGRFVVFNSGAWNLVPVDLNSGWDVFLRDRQAGTTERITVAPGGAEALPVNPPYYGDPAISSDGRIVTFASAASNLVPGDTNAQVDIFVKDRLSGTIERANVSSSGVESTGVFRNPSLSADGRFVAFQGADWFLVPGDTNGSMDMYVHDRAGMPVSSFCSGDGSGTACPCAAVGAAGHGCPSSIDPSGALLAWSGYPSLTADNLSLIGSAMPNAAALYYQGTAQQSGGAGASFGDGLRCAGGSIVRLGQETNVGGSSHYPAAGQLSVSNRGAVTSPGLRTYQVWYRNAAAFCTPATFNLSNGVLVHWAP